MGSRSCSLPRARPIARYGALPEGRQLPAAGRPREIWQTLAERTRTDSVRSTAAEPSSADRRPCAGRRRCRRRRFGRVGDDRAGHRASICPPAARLWGRRWWSTANNLSRSAFESTEGGFDVDNETTAPDRRAWDRPARSSKRRLDCLHVRFVARIVSRLGRDREDARGGDRTSAREGHVLARSRARARRDRRRRHEANRYRRSRRQQTSNPRASASTDRVIDDGDHAALVDRSPVG
jgi:hypothetical protein